MTSARITSLKVLSVIPPMTQLNTPYLSTAYLTGFLRSRQIESVPEDLALALVLRLLTDPGLLKVAEQIELMAQRQRSPTLDAFKAQLSRYLNTVESVSAFLQTRCRQIPSIPRMPHDA